MKNILRHQITKKLQKIFWVYYTNNFLVRSTDDVKVVEPKIKCDFTSITVNNYCRVGEFREEARIREYRNKLFQNEIGYFAEHNGKMIGSIWATLNKKDIDIIVRTYMQLLPNEGLIHDIVAGEMSRGMGVGSFMVSRLIPALFEDYGLNRIIIDVNVKNGASLRMMEKVGLVIDHKMLCISAFSKLIFQKIL